MPLDTDTTAPRPLEGVRVVEFSQMVMGPACGLILAELGAEVIKVEPTPKGDRTRYLPGLASGFFTAFNRSKKSIALDMKTPEGRAVVDRLIAEADVMIENFRPGMMGGQGLGYASLAAKHPKLVYCSLKGFLDGPYDKRTALDEVVQMMGGLAFMTGLPGKPMRAGASVNDIMGAMFGVIGIQAALREREKTGRGQEVQASLFENTAFLMSQSLLAEAITGVEGQPWSVQERPWTVYDLFATKGGTQLFFGIVGDTQWIDFCEEFDKPDWLADPRLRTNGDRTAARSWLMPEIRAMIAERGIEELSETFERIGLPFAPVRRPAELADDVHLNASGGLVEVALPDGRRARTPLLPLAFGGRRVGFDIDPPKVGAETIEILERLGFASTEIGQLTASGKVTAAETMVAAK